MCAMSLLAGSGVVIYHDLPNWQMPKASRQLDMELDNRLLNLTKLQ